MLDTYLEAALTGDNDYDRAQAQRLLLVMGRAVFQNSHLHPQRAVVCITTRVGGELGFTWYAWLVEAELVQYLPPGLCDWCLPLPSVHAIMRRYGQHLTCSLEQLGQWDPPDDWPSMGPDCAELYQSPVARDDSSAVPGDASPTNNP